jgi:hypothetical protein
MADIFISYASADRDRAKVLADALVKKGWSVWWDRTIPPGRQFDEVIEEELAAARCVVVLWSKASVASNWVKTEAAEAQKERVLVPALIEDVKIPLEFRRLQAADLSRWRGDPSDAQLAELFDAIGGQLRRGRSPAPQRTERDGSDDSRAEPSRPRPRRRSRFAIAAVGALAVAASVAGVYVVNENAAAARRARALEARERMAQKPVERAYPPVRATNVPAEPTRAEAPRAEAPRAEAPRAEAPRAESPRAKAPRTEPPHLEALRPSPAPRPTQVDISGLWRDVNWGHMSQVAQDGDVFRFQGWGNACRGSFRSAGSGSIQGTRFESAYRSSIPSEGRCSGMIMPDGTLRSTCFDSVCGSFASAAIRQ